MVQRRWRGLDSRTTHAWWESVQYTDRNVHTNITLLIESSISLHFVWISRTIILKILSRKDSYEIYKKKFIPREREKERKKEKKHDNFNFALKPIVFAHNPYQNQNTEKILPLLKNTLKMHDVLHTAYGVRPLHHRKLLQLVISSPLLSLLLLLLPSLCPPSSPFASVYR